MRYGLSDKEINLIVDIFKHHPHIEKVNVFGSRALGNYRGNSDIDLVLFGEANQNELATIIAELDELPLPYLFDVQVYQHIQHAGLKEHIDAHGKLFYKRDQ